MHKRSFGRTGRSVSELGVGMWGMGGGIGGWTGADDRRSMAVLQASVDAGITFFDSALVYGYGHTDQLLGELVRANPDRELFVASKVPPKNRQWPARAGDRISDVFPPDHIRTSVVGILRQMRVSSLDLVQFHVWQDAWADDREWQRAVEDLRRDGLVKHVGISVNRREPANVLATLRTGVIDAVQVVYNIFDQAPEDELIPLCRELGIAVIARVPLDEGSLAGRSHRGQPLARRGLAQQLLRPGQPRRDTPAGRGAAPAGARGPGDGPARPSVHPLQPGRDDGHPRHATAHAPRRQPRRGRGRASSPRPAGGPSTAPLGPAPVAASLS